MLMTKFEIVFMLSCAACTSAIKYVAINEKNALHFNRILYLHQNLWKNETKIKIELLIVQSKKVGYESVSKSNIISV